MEVPSGGRYAVDANVIFENGRAAHAVRTRAGAPLTPSEVGAWLGQATGRGLHSSILRLNVGTFFGIRWLTLVHFSAQHRHLL